MRCSVEEGCCGGRYSHLADAVSSSDGTACPDGEINEFSIFSYTVRTSNTDGRMAKPIPGGTPQMSRSQRQMYEFNLKKYNTAPIPASWADDVEPTGPTGPPNRRTTLDKKRGQPRGETGERLLPPMLREHPLSSKLSDEEDHSD